MQDYAIDDEGGMLQLHHEQKLTTALSGSITSPATQVGNTIYFVDELLQLKSRSYFTPEQFFQVALKDVDTAKHWSSWYGKEYELWALSWSVLLTDLQWGSKLFQCLLLRHRRVDTK